MRVVTHIFNHQGQVLAMCRSMGKPNDTIDLDYPVDGAEQRTTGPPRSPHRGRRPRRACIAGAREEGRKRHKTAKRERRRALAFPLQCAGGISPRIDGVNWDDVWATREAGTLGTHAVAFIGRPNIEAPRDTPE
jgi:hypothetical protein